MIERVFLALFDLWCRITGHQCPTCHRWDTYRPGPGQDQRCWPCATDPS